MRIDMRQLMGTGVLSGAINGSRALARLFAATVEEPMAPEPVFLDFAGVDTATASYLRESVLAFRNAVRNRRSNFYPVIANANRDVRDELEELVHSRNDVLIVCVLNAAGQVSNATLVGKLDPKQQITYELVRQREETDAAALKREYGSSEEKEVGQNAWNNRLAALAFRGLIMELSFGRSKKYRPLFVGT